MRRPLSGAVIAALLILFAASGLMAGALTRLVVTSPSIILVGRGAPSPTPGASVPSPTATQAPSQVSGQFILNISVTPKNAAPGQTMQVVVVATRNDGTPVAGLLCSLQTDSYFGPSLLTQWPAPVVSDASGQATWTLTVPNSAPGTYTIGDYAKGVTWSYRGHVAVSIT